MWTEQYSTLAFAERVHQMRSTTWLPRRSGPLLGAVVAMASMVGLFLPGVTPAANASPAPQAAPLTPAPGAYNPLTPTRVTDTRPASGSANAGSTLGPHGSVNVNLLFAGVPATATAVSLSVTAVDGTSNGFLSVYPTGSVPTTPASGTNPPTSVLNYVAGGPFCNVLDCAVPNLVVSQVSAGQVTVVNSSGGTVDVVVDLEGYFDAMNATTSGNGHYQALTPYRVADTRCVGSSQPSFCANENLPTSNTTAKLGAGQNLDVPVTGVSMPGLGISAAVVQITATDTTGPGYLTAYPTGGTKPTASNVNFTTAGQSTSTRAIVAVGANGDINIYNYTGNTNVVVDVMGLFSDATGLPADGSLYTPVTPARVVDTRPGSIGPMASLSPVQVSGANGIPASVNGSPTAAALNVTEASSTTGGFLSVTPNLQTPPVSTSDVNFAPGEFRANGDLATLDNSGAISIFNYLGNTQVAVDAFGYFSAASGG